MVYSIWNLSLTPGLLIDSERVYTQVTNEFLAQYGKGPITPEVKASLMGSACLGHEANLRSPWGQGIASIEVRLVM